MTRSSVILALAILLAAAACKTKSDPATPTESADDPSALAEDGADAVTAETDSELVTSSLVSATATNGSLTLASTDELNTEGMPTAALGDGVKAIYIPKGCLTVTGDAPTKTVTYVFDGCTGPNGIFKITGTVKATFATSPGLLVLDLVGTDLKVNRATIDWSAHSEIRSTGVDRSMTWKGQISGTTAKGRDFTRTNEKTVTWRFGERCFGLAGVSEGNIRGRYLKTEIANFKRCQGGCPEAGGSITISNAAKVKVEITFDGTRNATYATPKGMTTFDLGCGT